MGNTALSTAGWVVAAVWGGLGVAALLLFFAPNTRKHTAFCLGAALAFSLVMVLLGRS